MAILLAGLMTVLIVVAAMGVDLGNAWQRKVTVQKSVDVSAISAGNLLPRTSSQHRRHLRRGGQLPEQGEQHRRRPAWRPSQRRAAHTTTTWPTARSTFIDDNTMKVDRAQAARRLRPGQHHRRRRRRGDGRVRPSRSARRCPPSNSVLPMWLPSTCVYGPLAGDIAANPPPSASPTYTPNVTSSQPQRQRPRRRRPYAVCRPASIQYPSRSMTPPANDSWAGHPASRSATPSTSTTGSTFAPHGDDRAPSRCDRRRPDLARPLLAKAHRDQPQRQLDGHQHGGRRGRSGR